MDNAATLATIVIAAFTVALFGLQFWRHRHDKRVADANYKLALFDKRMETFNALEEMFSVFLREGQPTMEAMSKLRYEARNADFLFPEKPLVFVKEIIDKSFEHEIARNEWEPLRERAWNREPLTDDETVKKEQALGRMHEAARWFLAQVENGRLKNEFGPYLKMPESL